LTVTGPGWKRPIQASLPTLVRGVGMNIRRFLAAAAVLAASLAIAGPARAAPQSGTGGNVVVSIGRPCGNGGFQLLLFTMRADGSQRSRLTDPGCNAFDVSPSWSPDRSRVVFERDAADGSTSIYVVQRNGHDLKQIAACDPGSSDPCGNTTPAWSPDGKTIVFEHCCVPGNGGFLDGLYTMRPDGSQVEDLTLNPDINFGDTGPSVSPDSKWVSFTRLIGAKGNPDESVNALFTVPINVCHLQRLTSYRLLVDGTSWSPTNVIAFTAHRGGSPDRLRADVFTIDPNGKHLRQLTHTTPGTSLAFFPTWSPRGDGLLFVEQSPDTNCSDMFSMRSDGSHVHRITNTPSCESSIDWAA
jgi:Tol biopolymer transport system component